MEFTDLTRPKVSFLDSIYNTLWAFSANYARYSGYSRIYVWLYIRCFRFCLFLASWYNKNSPVQSLVDGMKEIELNRQDNEKPSKLDRAQLVSQSTLMYRLEVTLIYTPSCQQEAFQLITNDAADLTRLSSRIYYKTYYNAARNHGQSALDFLQASLTTIHNAHRSIRSLLARTLFPVVWEDHYLYFHRLAKSLQGVESKVSKGKHWQGLGFQGDDPATDFRGVGELGLQQLVTFCEDHPMYTEHMLEESGTSWSEGDIRLEGPWYPFALCGIHISKLLQIILQEAFLQRQFLQAQLNGSDGVEALSHTLYAFLFVRCHLDWATGVDKKEITSVFQFERFFEEFEIVIIRLLRQRRWEIDDFHLNMRWWVV